MIRQADIVRANKAWTDKDVQSSQDFMAQARPIVAAAQLFPRRQQSHTMTPTLMMNPSQTQAVSKSIKGFENTGIVATEQDSQLLGEA
jgi:Zn-dependent oligopeptidase